MNHIINIFTDGSYSEENKRGRWAFVAVLDDKIIHSQMGETFCPIICEGWQVGLECQAVIEAIKWSEKNNYKCKIAHDFNGLRHWVGDLFGEKPWKTNKVYTQNYRKFCFENRDIIVDFVKVKAHSGNRYNELVDSMMK